MASRCASRWANRGLVSTAVNKGKRVVRLVFCEWCSRWLAVEALLFERRHVAAKITMGDDCGGVCLDKAAIKLPEKQPSNRWKVCSVREVEDTKIGIRMLPMWLTFIVIGIVLSIGNTYFLEQANHMDRKLGKIKVPIPIFLLFYSATTEKVETRRLHRIRDHGLLDKPDEIIPMSIFALLPQFMLLAAVDGIANNSINSFFKHQAPKSVRKYLTCFTKGVLGLGTAASVLSVYIVGKSNKNLRQPKHILTAKAETSYNPLFHNINDPFAYSERAWQTLTWADMVAAYAMYVMMTYLTNVWKLSTTHAAGIINIWNGITPALAIVFGCLVDAFMGDFYMLVLSSISYSIGFGLLAMSTPPVFGPCSDYKEECIGHSQKKDQAEDDSKKAEDDSKTPWQILGSIMVVIVAIAGGIGLPYIKPWSVRFGIPAICSVVATLMFFTGFSVYKRTKPEGSPLTITLRVFLVAARNISQPLPNPEQLYNNKDKVLFYIALPLIAVGMAGHLVSLEPFLNLQIQTEKKDQAEDDSKKAEDDSKTPWQILGSIMVVIVAIAGGIGLPYIKPWSVRFGIPAICSVVATLMFFTGFSVYKRTKPEGSPLTITLRVFLVAARNISQPLPNPEQLYNNKDVRSTSTLRCFDKAAIKLPEEQEPKRWNVCSVGEVEDTKIGVRMLPMWLTFIVIGIVLSIGNTYSLEQANHMDRKLGKIKVSIPIFLLFYTYTSKISAHFYSNLETCLPKKYTPPVGIAVGMALSVLCCITAAKVETRRLHRIMDHGLLDKPDEMIPMSIFALLPQFMLLAAVDGIANNSIKTFFKHQTPKSVSKYLTLFSKGVLGLGTAASVLSVYVVGKVSERNQKPNWFQYTLNRSRLDRYYWVLAALSAANLVVYIIVSPFYTYKDITENAEDEEVEGGEMMEGFQEN
ncbi:proton-dependent oligopeptide transport (POT) family protein [Artemisia annua]|uniref:Proton-dependent oligopeptide transport (POT) family protein n=1 Tax=Artemisia annua TaxID=35608 RepID=A0A2U1KSS3_ARTAN|nr:proton-dependent oligopeptide transport (POT) family protein [Artemisia annua]